MPQNLTSGPVARPMLLFALPMIAGNLLQQCYNIADTLIVGRTLGSGALAAVGSSYTLMVLLTSVLLGLCMGSGVLFSMQYSSGEHQLLRQTAALSFSLIAIIAAVIQAAVMLLIRPILWLLQIPADILDLTHEYLSVIFLGIFFTFLYNYFAACLRAVGNSAVPLIFLAVSAVLNILLDLLFILSFGMGVAGAAWATVASQGVSAVGIAWYTLKKEPLFALSRKDFRFDRQLLSKITRFSLLTCVQQSVMNFGILMIQGLVNSFGTVVMAGFAAAVKIDSFAYMPVQDFGNAFSTYIAQNAGIGDRERIRKGLRFAAAAAFGFCIVISLLVCLFAPQLMQIFVKAEETAVISVGVTYLRIEGSCYAGIGCLFLFYGLFRGLGKPGVSVVLTVISLGTRVLLAYLLAPVPAIGLVGIWWAIPIGWFLADLAGLFFWKKDSAALSSQ